MKLSTKPFKDGMVSKYECGFKTVGSWVTRLTEHETFCKTEMGAYILKLEDSQKSSVLPSIISTEQSGAASCDHQYVVEKVYNLLDMPTKKCIKCGKRIMMIS